MTCWPGHEHVFIWRQSSSTTSPDSATEEENTNISIIVWSTNHRPLCWCDCHIVLITSMKPNSIWPDPSLSSFLKVSVVKKNNKVNYKTTLFLHECRKEIWAHPMRTHWRVTPSESGSTQSCQSQWWGFVRCSGPRWSDAGGCWERSLCKCKN